MSINKMAMFLKETKMTTIMILYIFMSASRMSTSFRKKKSTESHMYLIMTQKFFPYNVNIKIAFCNIKVQTRSQRH